MYLPWAVFGRSFYLQVIRPKDETWDNLFESAGLEVKLMISPPALEKEAAVQEFLKDKVGELLTLKRKLW